ncbi:hypothetical protein [Sodalis sp.]
MAPIALDVVWDHFLSRHWLQKSRTQSLNCYLWMENWLLRYADGPFGS